MLWFFVALQTMTPFIHAHAGSVQLDHGGLLHVHQGGHADAAYHAVAASEHGAEVEVAQGVPVRKAALFTPASVQAVVVSPVLQHAEAPRRPGAGLLAPPFHPERPDHTLPHALAPPAI